MTADVTGEGRIAADDASVNGLIGHTQGGGMPMMTDGDLSRIRGYGSPKFG